MEESITLFVGGLSQAITEDDLQAYFSLYSTVLSATLVKDPRSGASKGFGFVSISSASAAFALVKMKNFICGRRVECQLASSRGEKKQCKEHMKRRKLFISNIPVGATNDELDELFSQFGLTHNSYNIQQVGSLINQPYGFVEYEDPEDAQKLLIQNPLLSLRGSTLRISGYLDKDQQITLKRMRNSLMTLTKDYCPSAISQDTPNKHQHSSTIQVSQRPSDETILVKPSGRISSFLSKYPSRQQKQQPEQLGPGQSNYVFRVNISRIRILNPVADDLLHQKRRISDLSSSPSGQSPIW